MKIAMVCSHAEPGRDGVGDASVRIASGLTDQGHTTLVIAERDTMLAANVPSVEMRNSVRVVRLPGTATDERRGSWLSAELRSFAPDWVLVQFVCWGLADRGVLDPLPTALLAALSDWRVAVYCHELWLGLERGATLRHRWWGRQQRRSILRFFEIMRPRLMLTSNPVYAAVLERFGWKTRIVPLHSNIPVIEGAAAEARELIAQRLRRKPWSARREVLMLAVFGSVFPSWDPRQALNWLQAEARRRGQRVLFVSIGRPSRIGEAQLTQLAQMAGPSLSFLTLGEAAPRMVSGLLQEADVGLPATDWLLLGKSGAAAAMQDHGLPMLVVRSEQQFRDLPDFSVTHPASVFRFDAVTPPQYEALIRARRPAGDSLLHVASTLADVLQLSS